MADVDRHRRPRADCLPPGTGQAETYKVRAFRRAARSLADVDPDKLGRLAGAGRLQEVPGIGETTARVIQEALRDRTRPTCSSSSRTRAWASEPTPIGSVSRAPGRLPQPFRLVGRGQLHPGDGPGRAALGHRYLALTDHSPRLTVAHGLDADRLRAQLDVVERAQR